MSITAVTPDTGLSEEQVAARQRIAELPLEQLDPGDPEAFRTLEMLWKFERLRREDPVHFTAAEHTTLGHYWSLTRWEDIMAADADHESFSAETQIVLADPADVSTLDLNRDAKAVGGTVQLEERPEDEQAPPPEQAFRSLLSMDPPDHELHRGAVQDGVSPKTLKDLEPVIRERAGAILDGLPIGEEFDWVDLVSKELTAMTLATLFDFPQEDRRKLTYWSDVTM
ncbi:MAG: cytochrome P450, partial [Frankiales bacterium]|nr:cytochrome P450 [Frankiales bacterium]